MRKLLQLMSVSIMVFVLLIGAASAIGQARGGAMFAFVSDRSGMDEIYVMDVGLGIAHRHNPINTHGLSPTWSNDGLLAFVSGDSDGGHELWISDGHSTTIVEFQSNSFSPKWSPDGTRIAFLVSDDEGVQNIHIWNRHSGEIDQLTDQSLPIVWFEWSPDSTRIAFLHYPFRDHYPLTDDAIYIVNVENGNIFSIGTPRGIANSFVWSPDGTRLAFSVLGNGANIMMWNSLDNSIQPLMENAAHPAWSPDGEWLAYTVWIGEDSDVFILHIASGETHNLTNNPTNLFFPRWSPDGAYVDFTVSQIGGAFDLYLVEVATGEVRNLTNNGGRWTDYQLAWHP